MRLVSVLALFLFSLSALGGGTFTSVKGSVFIKKPDRDEEKARRGSKVEPGDQIRTEKASFAKVAMVDKNVFHIGPSSALVFEKYEGEGESKNATLSLLYGRLRSSLETKYDDDENRFRVNTKTAIMGVRGTDFLTSYAQSTEQVRVITFEGLVAVSGIGENGETFGTQELGPGQMTLVNLGQAPFEPLQLPTQQIQKFDDSSQSEEKSSLEEAATEKDAVSVASSTIQVPSVDTKAATYDNLADRKVVGDTQGQFVRVIVPDDDDD